MRPRDVQHEVHAFGEALHRVGLRQITGVDLDLPAVRDLERTLAARPTERTDLVSGRAETAQHVASDEAGGAGEGNFHEQEAGGPADEDLEGRSGKEGGKAYRVGPQRPECRRE